MRQPTLAMHALACWLTEGSESCRAVYDALGNKKLSLYFRTRAVVGYDRAQRDLLAGKPELSVEFARRSAPGGA